MGVAKEMSQQLIGCFRSVIPMLTTLVVLLLLLAPEGLHATDAGGVPEAMKGEEKKAAVETVGGEGSSDPVAVAAPAVRPPRKEDPDKTKPGTVVQMAHHWYSVVEKLGQGAAGSIWLAHQHAGQAPAGAGEGGEKAARPHHAHGGQTEEMRGKAVEERPSVGAGAGAGGAGGHEKQVALKEIDYSKRQKEVTRAEGESDESVAKKEKAAFQEMVDNFLQEAVVAQYFLDPKHGHAPHNHVVQMLETKNDAGKKKLWVAMEAGKDDLDKRWRTKLVAHYLDYLLGRRDPSGGDKHHHSPDYVMAAQFVTGIAIQAGLGLVELNKGFLNLDFKPNNMLLAHRPTPTHDWPEHFPVHLIEQLNKDMGRIELIDFQGSSSKWVKKNAHGHDSECPAPRDFGYGRFASVSPESLYYCSGAHQLTTKSDVFAFGVFLNDLIFPPVLVGVVPASKKFAFIFRTKTPMTKPDWCGVDNRQTELLNQVSYLKEVSDDKTQKIRSKITMKMTVAATLVNVLEQQAMTHTDQQVATKLLSRSRHLSAEQVAVDSKDRVDPKELGLFDHGTEAGLTPEQAADIPKVTKAFARILHVIKACTNIDPEQRPALVDVIQYLKGHGHELVVPHPAAAVAEHSQGHHQHVAHQPSSPRHRVKRSGHGGGVGEQAQQGEQDEQAVQGGEPQSVAAVAQAMRVLYQAFVDKVSDALSKPAPIPEETLKEWLKDIGDKREGIIGVIGSKLAAINGVCKKVAAAGGKPDPSCHPVVDLHYQHNLFGDGPPAAPKGEPASASGVGGGHEHGHGHGTAAHGGGVGGEKGGHHHPPPPAPVAGGGSGEGGEPEPPAGSPAKRSRREE